MKTFEIYLKDPMKLIMDEANHMSLNNEWDLSIQVKVENKEDINNKIPKEYENWYITKIENVN